jgi:hypothetical protein
MGAFDMSPPLRSLNVLGVHSVVPTEQEFREAVAIQWGEDLTAEQSRRAEGDVREHFGNLYLLEIEIDPPDADIDWSAITQSIDGQPRANWQVPYGECRLEELKSHWAFFFHFLDPRRPLRTQLGDRELPEATPIPEHLRRVRYEVPG